METAKLPITVPDADMIHVVLANDRLLVDVMVHGRLLALVANPPPATLTVPSKVP